ncbi:MAG TPA: helix-turn-helix domain-containing protein [Poseidonia sp.]|nr:helix-turn-helix domain-containing protein [Poseidonia sp.]
MGVEKKSSSGDARITLKPMPKPPMKIPSDAFAALQSNIEGTLDNGKVIRSTLAAYSNTGPYNADWEVEAAVEALHVFGSRWTIEILATLYITGPRRFNEMKNMLSGISSRTLSDKLRFLADEGLVLRIVTEGPPVKVSYELSKHGLTCGRLLSPLVAHLKVKMGSVQEE